MRVVATLICVIGMYATLQLSYADYLAHSGSASDLDFAIKLAPLRADYLLRRARLGGANATADLHRAAELEPGNAAPWIELGLLEESSGNFLSAEKAFLSAQSRDHTYQPRWTLANYFLRRGNMGEFWRWSTSAAQILDGDPSALYRLCLRAANDPGEVSRRVVMKRPETQRRFLEILLADRVLSEVPHATRTLAQHGLPRDRPLLLSAVSAVALDNRVPEAIEVWNHLISRGYLSHQPLQPENGVSLTNPNWSQPLSQAAFDWQVPIVEGVSVSQKKGGGLVLGFSGDRVSEEILLRQRLPLLVGARYRLLYTYDRTDPAPAAAAQWKIGGQSSALLDGTSVTSASFEFTAPVEALAQLDLILNRKTGTTWPSGQLHLRKAELYLLR